MIAVVALFMFYVIVQYVIYSPREAGAVSSKLTDALFPYRPWVYFLYGHIAAGSAAFIIGPFQLMRKPAGGHAKLHRRLGYLYVAAIAVGGICGAYLSYFATGGPMAGLGFLALDLV
jgi:uncharacterized membrane protein